MYRSTIATGITAGVSTVGGTVSTCIKKDGKNISPNLKGIGTTLAGAAATASTTGSVYANYNSEANWYLQQELKNQRATEAYVDSLSDQELQIALEQLGELETTQYSEEKTR